MTTKTLAFTGVDGTESSAKALITAPSVGRSAGRWGVIKYLAMVQASGDGTQWKIRFYEGFTATPKSQYITSVTLPVVAGSFDDGAGTAASSAATTPAPFDTRIANFANGWTDADTSKAGLTVYVTVEQLANGGATNDAINLRIITGRR